MCCAAIRRTRSSTRCSIATRRCCACWQQVTGAGAMGRRQGSDTLQASRPRCRAARGAPRGVPRPEVRDHRGAGHMLHHDQPEAVARVIEDVPGALMAQYFIIHPTHRRRADERTADIVRRRRRDRLSDRLLLRAGLPSRRQGGDGAHPRIRQRGRAPPLHADVPRPVGDRRATPRWTTSSSACSRRHAGQLHLHPAAPRAKCRAACSIPGATRSACASPIIRWRMALLAELGEPMLSSTLILPGRRRRR